MNDRDERVLFLREVRCLTYEQIAEEIGCTTSRARQLYQRALERRFRWVGPGAVSEEFDPNKGDFLALVEAVRTMPGANQRKNPEHLAARTLRLLGRNELTLRDTMKMSDEQLRALEMLGATTLVAIRLATGLPHPFKRLPMVCPHCGGKIFQATGEVTP
jgi:hypothetical protein